MQITVHQSITPEAAARAARRAGRSMRRSIVVIVVSLLVIIALPHWAELGSATASMSRFAGLLSDPGFAWPLGIECLLLFFWIRFELSSNRGARREARERPDAEIVFTEERLFWVTLLAEWAVDWSLVDGVTEYSDMFLIREGGATSFVLKDGFAPGDVEAFRAFIARHELTRK